MGKHTKIWKRVDETTDRIIIYFTLDGLEMLEGVTSITMKEIVIERKLTSIRNYLDDFFSGQEQYQKNILRKIKEDT
jgi:hypothetical protein